MRFTPNEITALYGTSGFMASCTGGAIASSIWGIELTLAHFLGWAIGACLVALFMRWLASNTETRDNG